MLGVGTLFSWNAFITAATYYTSRFCHTKHEKTFENDVGVVYMAANLASLIVVVRYQNLFTRRFRVLGSFLAWFAVFCFITVQVLMKDTDPEFLYWSTLASCLLSGVFSAICAGGVFGMMAQFPPMYVQAVMSGQGLSGVTAALVAAAASYTAASTSGDSNCDDADDPANNADDSSGDCDSYTEVDYGSFTYFLVACLIFLLCIVSYIVLETTPFAKYYDAAPSAELVGGSARDDDSSDGADGVVASMADSGDAYSPLHGDVGFEASDAQPKAGGEESVLRPTPSIKDYVRVIGQVYREAFSVWLVFTITISLFPALTALIEPSATSDCGGSGLFTKSTFTATMFLAFNGFDLVGRSSAGFVQVCIVFMVSNNLGSRYNIHVDFPCMYQSPQLISKEWLPTASIARLVFYPLFATCNVSGSRLGVVFENSWLALLIMTFMALSNGYVSTLSMIYGPQRVEPGLDSEIAGSVMILALTFGLFSGSMLSYFVTFVVTG